MKEKIFMKIKRQYSGSDLWLQVVAFFYFHSIRREVPTYIGQVHYLQKSGFKIK